MERIFTAISAIFFIITLLFGIIGGLIDFIYYVFYQKILIDLTYITIGIILLPIICLTLIYFGGIH